MSDDFEGDVKLNVNLRNRRVCRDLRENVPKHCVDINEEKNDLVNHKFKFLL